MTKARELAELSRTIIDTSDATAITINADEEVTLADDLFLADDKQLVLGNSSDFTLKHHNSGYGHVQNTGTLYIDSETIDLRTDNSSISSALSLAANNAATFSGSVTAASLTVTGALIANDVLTVIDGSTSAPSISNAGDSNSGIYFPADDELGLLVGGSRKLHVTSSGVDIENGTLTGGAATFNSSGSFGGTLDASGTILASAAAVVNSTSKGGFGYASNNTAFYSFGADASTAGSYTFQNLSNNASINITAMKIAADGNVGIGTTGPNSYSNQTVLTINGTNYGRVDLEAGGSLKGSVFGGGDGLNLDAGVNQLVMFAGGGEAMRISGSSVGIGTSSPVNNANRNTLALQGAWGGQLDIMVGSTVHAQFGTDNFGSGQSCRIQSQDGIVFRVGGNTQAARLDSSGNLLHGGSVDTTLYNNTSGGGINLMASNRFDVARAGDVVATFNRMTDAGQVIQLYQAGSLAGGLGVSGTDATIGTGDTGITFEDAANAVHPVNYTTGAARDNAVDLGKSAARFRNLHLSGEAKAKGVHGTSVNNADDGLVVKAGSGDSASSRGRFSNNAADVAIGRNIATFPGTWTKADNSVASAGWVFGTSGAAAFYQSNAGDTTPLANQRFRIMDGSNNGRVVIGSSTTTHTYDATKILLSGAGTLVSAYNLASTNEFWILNNLANIASGVVCKVDFRVLNSSKGYIGITSTGVQYNQGSDYRLKDELNYDFDATSLVKKIKPVQFKWLADMDAGIDTGFIAHELQEVHPFAVSGEKDAVREDGEIAPQGVDASKLVGLLTKALQEALSRIDSLEGKVKALEEAA